MRQIQVKPFNGANVKGSEENGHKDDTHSGEAGGRHALGTFIRAHRSHMTSAVAVVSVLVSVGLALVVFCNKEEISQLSISLDALKRDLYNLRNRTAVFEQCPHQMSKRTGNQARVSACAGPPGPPGEKGPVGPPGRPGQKGHMGPAGPASAGPPGPPGEMGPIGPIGPRGLMGPTGPTGPPGERGPVGPRGLIGPAGPPGPPGNGPMGSISPRGMVGPVGPPGPPVEMGLMGPVGPRGLVGPAGPPGNRGERGPVGLVGPRGLVGPVGPPGEIGPVGPVGPQGLVGPVGPPGSPGNQGPMRTQGLKGSLGLPDQQGANPTAPPGRRQISGSESTSIKGTQRSAADAISSRITFGGTGTVPGKFSSPSGVAVSSTNEILVADYNTRRIQVFDMRGVFLRMSSTGHMKPRAICVDRNGYLWVVSNDPEPVVHKYSSDGRYLTSRFSITPDRLPTAIAADSLSDNLIVTVARRQGMGTGGAMVLRPDGALVRMFGVHGQSYPTSVTVDKEGSIFIADLNNGHVNKYDKNGNFLLRFGGGSLKSPFGMCVDSLGRLIVADGRNNRVEMFTPEGDHIRTVANVKGPKFVATGRNGQLVVTADGRTITVFLSY